MSILRRVLPPEDKSIRSTSKETGISEQTIRSWIKQSKAGIFDSVKDEKNPRHYSSREKYQLVMEAARVSEEKLGGFLRERGLHTEHLTMWDQELREIMTLKEDKRDKQLKALKRQNRELEKELSRKEKALAEAAALLILKKKLDTHMMDPEDD